MYKRQVHTPTQPVRAWKQALDQAGITLFLLSNSRKPGRAQRFAEADVYKRQPPRGAGGPPPRKRRRRKILVTVLLVLLALLAIGFVIHQIYVRPPDIRCV